ncbi:MAG: transcription antitermination factor NusB [bacterium]
MADRTADHRSSTGSRPAGRPDPARRAAFQLLRTVDADGAYANLALPRLLRDHRLGSRDAALATELAYGTLRAQGILDEIIAGCARRPVERLDAPVLDLLRLGTYQILRTRIPPHAAVSATVDLSRRVGAGRSGGLINAVLRAVTDRTWDEWADEITVGRPALERLAARHAHPVWIAEAFAGVLPAEELAEALESDDQRPATHLVARPDLIERDELVRAAGPNAQPGPWSPYAVRLDGGDPGHLAPVRDGRAGVQDEGSQLAALALVNVELTGRDAHWLDLCAGPGGKTAILAGVAARRGADVTANELHEHRAELVRATTAHWSVEVIVGNAADVPVRDCGYDRVLLDAPCTGLGALRRRPEARWRRTPEDLVALGALQARLLDAAIRLSRSGGVIAYVTCSPHAQETSAIVAGAVETGAVVPIDARPAFPGVPNLGDGPFVQLWPHRHGTDAMFTALLRRT